MDARTTKLAMSAARTAADRNVLNAAVASAATCSPATGLVADRLPLIEAGRGIAACLIVAHHLTAYGPLPDIAASVALGPIRFLYEYGRMVVYVFLVIGGFALATSIQIERLDGRGVLRAFAWRYLRIGAPYVAMLAILLVASLAMRGRAFDPPLIDSVSGPQLIAHLFFLQDLFGYGNISAGIWYLCIDMQFAALYLLVVALGRFVSGRMWSEIATRQIVMAILFPLGIWSAWDWNRDPGGDSRVFYFLAPLVLGVGLAFWRQRFLSTSLFAMLVAAVGLSLAADFRWRLALAVVTVVSLAVSMRSPFIHRLAVPLIPLGRISYSLFLIHYLVNWIVTTSMAGFVAGSPWRAIAVMLAAFACSLCTALMFYRFVEQPVQRWARNWRPAERPPEKSQPASLLEA
ncbi:MAG: acyltransferase [Planctomycetes bacterium]|nr:acyltransferase [Planctomycetota bacterium]